MAFSRAAIGIVLIQSLGRFGVFVAFIAICFTSSGCYDAYGVRQLEAKKKVYDSQIAAAERKLAEMAEKNAEMAPRAEQVRKFRASVESVIKSRSIEKKEIEDLEHDYLRILAVLKACQTSFKSKSLIKEGDVFDSLELKGGQILKGVTVKGVDPNSLKLSHSGGLGLYRVADLPDALARKFIIPPVAPRRYTDPLVLFVKKPSVLMSQEEEAAMSRKFAAIEREEMERKFKRDDVERELKRSQERRVLAANEARDAQKEKNRQEKRSVIDGKISYLRDRNSTLERQKSALQDRWSRSTIKPSQLDQDKQMGRLDKQIELNNQAVRQLEAERSGL